MKRILSIDDDQDFSKLLFAILKKNGFDIVTTNRVGDFFEKLKDGQWDLCLVDLNLDKLHGAGFQIIKAIRNKLGFSTPLLVISRRSSDQDISYALEVGATDYIQKPIDEMTLMSKISSALSLKELQASNQVSYKKISGPSTKVEIGFKISIKAVSEIGITLCSTKFIAKGTRLNLSGDLIQQLFEQAKIKLSVTKNWVDEDKNYMLCEFEELDSDTNARIRHWIDEKKQALYPTNL